MRLPGVLRGQLALGLAVLALGVLVLGGLKRLESSWKQDRHATLSIKVTRMVRPKASPPPACKQADMKIRPWAVTFVDQGRQRQLRAEVRWRARPQEARSHNFFRALSISQGCFNWNGSRNVCRLQRRKICG